MLKSADDSISAVNWLVSGVVAILFVFWVAWVRHSFINRGLTSTIFWLILGAGAFFHLGSLSRQQLESDCTTNVSSIRGDFSQGLLDAVKSGNRAELAIHDSTVVQTKLVALVSLSPEEREIHAELCSQMKELRSIAYALLPFGEALETPIEVTGEVAALLARFRELTSEVNSGLGVSEPIL